GTGTVATFTTGTNTQPSAPTVVGVTPPDGATGVPVNAVIQVQLSGPVSGTTVTPGTLTVTPSGGSPVAGTVSVCCGTTVVSFTPASALSASTPYTVALTGVTDLAGHAVAAFT